MKKATLLLMMVSCLAVKAQTIHVNGFQTGVWEADTVFVDGDVTVMDSLRVMPGTKVLFNGFYGIDVSKGASFKAQGTASDSIAFTVVDTTGFFKYESENGGWKGFRLFLAGPCLWDYCVLEYGKAFLDDEFGGVLDIAGCDDVKVLHSTLRHSAAHLRGGAICAIDSHVLMQACAVNGNTVYNPENIYIYGGAACFLRSDVELREMEFRNNVAPTIGGALSIDSCSAVLDRSVFVNNVGVNGGGLYMMRCADMECRMSNLLFDNNFTYHFGGGFAISDSSPEIFNVLVTNNRSEGVSCNGVFFYGDCSPRLTNCIVYGNYPDADGSHIDTTQMWAWTMNGHAPEFRNCLIEGDSAYIQSFHLIKVFENIIDTDPLFVDAEHHDFRLQSESPCRDAGAVETPDWVTEGFDLSGVIRRVSNQRIDIGPYEYSAASVPCEAVAPPVRLAGNPLCPDSRIEFDEALCGTVTVSLYDMVGHCCVSGTFDVGGARSLAIGRWTEHLTPGVYVIEVKGLHGSYTLKAVR